MTFAKNGFKPVLSLMASALQAALSLIRCPLSWLASVLNTVGAIAQSRGVFIVSQGEM